jgi:hypothetical protein
VRPTIQNSTADTTSAPDEGHQLGHRDHRGADGHRAQRVGGVDGARVGLEEQQRQVLQHDGDAQRDQQDVLVLAVAGAVDDHALQRVAQREHAGTMMGSAR